MPINLAEKPRTLSKCLIDRLKKAKPDTVKCWQEQRGRGAGKRQALGCANILRSKFGARGARRCGTWISRPYRMPRRPSSTIWPAGSGAASAPGPAAGRSQHLLQLTQRPVTPIRRSEHGAICDNDQPGRDLRALPAHEPVRGQLAADVGRLPRLSGAGGPQCRPRARADHDALGHAATGVGFGSAPIAT
jgi:hypothetical protein